MININNLIRKLKIKWRIILLISGIGIIVSMLLGFYAPGSARRMGEAIMVNDVSFISTLLADNLALGIQTRIFDDGAALQQTLDHIQALSRKQKNVIEQVAVYDENGVLVTSLMQDKAIPLIKTEKMIIDLQDISIRVWNPLRDMDQNLVGYCVVDFSKHFFRQKASLLGSRGMIIGLLVLALTVLGGLYLSRSVSRGLQRAVSVMMDIAEGEGDLTRRIPIENDDEIGELNRWINAFMDRLHDLILQVKENTIQVTIAVREITSASNEMATGAEEQNSQASEVSASVEEMTSSIMETSQNAGETAKISETATKKAQQGSQAMQVTRQSIQDIVQSTDRMRGIITALRDRAGQIGRVTQVIDKIADQTNLLALNAAVEAARAGEQGSGFAVVADEVRKLAERTTQATKEISETIEVIQKDTQSASESMNETNTKVAHGAWATEQTEKVLDEIVESVAQAMDMIQQIAAASEEQSAGAEEISSSVEAISTITKQSAVNAETMASAAQQLSRQTDALQKVVSQFRLKT